VHLDSGRTLGSGGPKQAVLGQAAPRLLKSTSPTHPPSGASMLSVRSAARGTAPSLSGRVWGWAWGARARGLCSAGGDGEETPRPDDHPWPRMCQAPGSFTPEERVSPGFRGLVFRGVRGWG